MDAIEKRARELLANVRHWDHPDCQLQVIIAALTPPEGYVLVPVEPTDEMLGGLYECHLLDASEEELRAAYAELLAARPEVP